MRHRLASTLLCAAVVCFAGPASASANSQIGAVTTATWSQPRSVVDTEIDLLAGAGVHWVRANANWSELEPDAPGVYDDAVLRTYDYAVDELGAAGMEILMPIADGVPYWASADPDKYVDARGERHWDRMYPPQKMSEYGRIVRQIVARYSARGVHAYEIWNEPNLNWFWRPRPDPRQYVRMLRAGYRAVKSADPRATVVLGGLSHNDYKFLERLYRAGAGRYFDAVAVHPYTAAPPTMKWSGANDGPKGDPDRLSWVCFPGIKEIHRTMKAHGDARKKVWLTEFGVPTGSGEWSVSESTQAEWLQEAYRYIERFPWVKAMFWYMARNHPGMPRSPDDLANYGLMTADFALKPSYYALRSLGLGG
jgi:hypothetical protein